MSQSDNQHSSFDKNLRSLLDAVAMFEREAGLMMDRLGFDSESVGRVLELLGSISSEAVRPLAGALGIADTAAVESLARDVRALLQAEARQRREQSTTNSRLDELLAAVEALGATTARLADLQGQTQERLDALAARAVSIEGMEAQRQRLAAELAGLKQRIDTLDAVLGTGDAAAEFSEEESAGIRPGGARRPVQRTVKVTPPSGKILEGLPSLEPKVRPA
jgi:septal ring factor EnvC (AmiA/AmiB activator)